MHTILHHVKLFAKAHDDMPAFHAGFLVLSVLVSLFFSMGVFAMLILFHAALDVAKYRMVHNLSARGTLKGVIRENLLDVTLVTIGLTAAVCFHHHIFFGSVSSLVRADIFLLRMIGTTLPKMQIFHSFMCVAASMRSYIHTKHEQLEMPWSAFDKACFIIMLLGIALFLATPFIFGIDQSTIQKILVEEMTPHMVRY